MTVAEKVNIIENYLNEMNDYSDEFKAEILSEMDEMINECRYEEEFFDNLTM